MPEKRPQNTIEVLVSTAMCVQSIHTIEEQTVWGLRALVGAKFEIELRLIVLVYGGKILCDIGTLRDHCIVDGVTVYMVVNRAAKRQQQRPLFGTRRLRSPIGAPCLTLSSPVTLLFPAASAAASIVKPKSKIAAPKLSSNYTSLLDKLAEAAAVEEAATGKKRKRVSIRLSLKDIINDPDVIRTLVFKSPRMQRLMENFPHVRHILNSDANIRDMTMTLLNPARMSEMARKRDLSLMRVEAMPGGTALLHRLINCMSDPLEMASGARSSTSKKQTEYINPQLGKENCMPLPNAWLSPPTRSDATNRRVCRSYVSKLEPNNANSDKLKVRLHLTRNRVSTRQNREMPVMRAMARVLKNSNVNCNISLDAEELEQSVAVAAPAPIVDNNISGNNDGGVGTIDGTMQQQQRLHQSGAGAGASDVKIPKSNVVVAQQMEADAATANETSELSDESIDEPINSSSTTSVQTESVEDAAADATVHYRAELEQMKTTTD